MSTAYWILGAVDPEMEMIERLLRESMQHVVFALHGGERVRPESAYRADGLSESIPEDARVYRVECDGPAVPAGAQAIDHHRPGDPGYGRPPEDFMAASSIGQVIAELARLGRMGRWARDEGSLQRPRLSPGELRCCSVRSSGSLGCSDHYAYGAGDWSLAWMVGAGYWSNGICGGDTALYVPRDLVLCAAADHCPDAARRGECPGVDPDALMRWRVAEAAS